MSPKTLAFALVVASFVSAIVGESVPLAHAGIENVQSALVGEPEEGAAGSATLSADLRTGNVSFLFLSASLHSKYRQGQHVWLALAKFDRKTNDDAVLVNRTFEHLRYRYLHSESWLAEVFAQHEFNGIKQLRLRTLIGAGPKFTWRASDDAEFGLGVAYMFEGEVVREPNPAGGTDDVSDLAHRISSYLVGSYEPNERVQLVETFYVQPRLTDANDLRLLSDASVIAKITEMIAFTTSFNVSYDSRPPSGVKKLDTALKSSVTISF